MRKREPKVTLVCSHCGASFARQAWKVRQAVTLGAKPYCGYACSRAARRVHTEESKREYHRLYREENRERIRANQKAERHGEKRDHVLERDRAIYRRNIEINRQRAREYAARHREEAKERRKVWPFQNPDRYDFHIARSTIAQSMGILPSQIPDDLAEAKAEQLRISRWVKEQTKK